MPLNQISNLKNPLYYYMLNNKSEHDQIKVSANSLYLNLSHQETHLHLEQGVYKIESSHIRVPEEYNRLNHYNYYHYTFVVSEDGTNESVIHIYVPSRPKSMVVSVRNSQHQEIYLSENDKNKLIEFTNNKIQSVISQYCDGLQNEIDTLCEAQKYILDFDSPDVVEHILEKTTAWLSKYKELSAMGLFCRKFKVKEIQAVFDRLTALKSSHFLPATDVVSSSDEGFLLSDSKVDSIEEKDVKILGPIPSTLFAPDPMIVDNKIRNELILALAKLNDYDQRIAGGSGLSHDEAIDYHDTSRHASFLSFIIQLTPAEEVKIQYYIEKSTAQCTKLMEKIWYSTRDDFCCLKTGVDQSDLLEELSLRSDIFIPGGISKNDPLRSFILMRSPNKIDWLCKYCDDTPGFSFNQSIVEGYIKLCIEDRKSHNDGLECFLSLLRNGFQLSDFWTLLMNLMPFFIEKLGESNARQKIVLFVSEFEKCEKIHQEYDKRHKFSERILKLTEQKDLLIESSANYQANYAQICFQILTIDHQKYLYRVELLTNLRKAFPEKGEVKVLGSYVSPKATQNHVVQSSI